MNPIPYLEKKPASLSWRPALMTLCGALALYVGYVIGAIAAARFLHADGSLCFVTLTNNGDAWPVFNDDTVNRLFPNLLIQFPTTFALWAGVRDLDVLRTLFGFGMFAMPALGLLYALWLARRAGDTLVQCLIGLSYVTCCIPSEIFIYNQAYMASAIVWILACYAVLPLQLRWWDIAVILLGGIETIRGHEGSVVTGPLLALLAAMGMIREWHQNHTLRAPMQLARGWIIATGIFACTYGFHWLQTHPTQQSAQNFLGLLQLLRPDYMWGGNTRVVMFVLIGAIAVLGFAGFDHFTSGRKLRRAWGFLPAVIFTLAALAVFAGLRLWFNTNLAAPFLEFQYRFLVIFGVAGWIVLLFLIMALRVTVPRGGQILLVYLIAGGLAGGSIWQMANTMLWSQFAADARLTLARATHPIVPAADILKYMNPTDPALRYKWEWNWSAFGLALQETPHVTAIFAPENFLNFLQVPGRDANTIQVPFNELHGRALDFTMLNSLCANNACRLPAMHMPDKPVDVSALHLFVPAETFTLAPKTAGQIPVIVANESGKDWPDKTNLDPRSFGLSFRLTMPDGNIVTADGATLLEAPIAAKSSHTVMLLIPPLPEGIYRLEPGLLQTGKQIFWPPDIHADSVTLKVE